MALIFNAWGPAGTLTSVDDFDRYQGNGEQEDTPFTTAANRVELVGDYLRIRRVAGDAEAASGNRTEVLSLDETQVADWTSEAGFDVNEATRWYRSRFRVPSDFPTDFLSGSGEFVLLHQLHVRPDSNDAGTSPSLSVQIKRDTYGRLRYALIRNAGADAQQVSNNNVEIASWRFRAGEWQDILTHVKWSWTTEGNMTVYLNRRPILVETGVMNTVNNAPSRGGGGLYPKIGIYTSADLGMTVDHSGLIVGDYQSSFAEMHPEAPAAAPLERVSGPVASAT